MTAPTPERALRLAIVGWGLGDLAMGRTGSGVAWLGAEALFLAGTLAATLLWADTTWYLIPYLLGVAFLVIWAGKAILTFRAARGLQAAAPTAQLRSPAATIAWLALPLLAWGTGFWLVAGAGSTPAAALDAFVERWPEIAPLQPPGFPMHDAGPDDLVDRSAGLALGRLEELCALGLLAEDCGEAPENLLRDVRVTLVDETDATAIADAELVEFQRRPTRLFGLFSGSELVPVPVESVLRLDLEARPAALGAREWTIVNATAP